jgi:acid phosphatase
VPNTSGKCAAGNGVLDAVIKTWGGAAQTYNYTSVVPSDASNVGGTGTSPSPSPTKKAGASHLAGASFAAVLCAVFAVALTL